MQDVARAMPQCALGRLRQNFNIKLVEHPNGSEIVVRSDTLARMTQVSGRVIRNSGQGFVMECDFFVLCTHRHWFCWRLSRPGELHCSSGGSKLLPLYVHETDNKYIRIRYALIQAILSR